EEAVNKPGLQIPHEPRANLQIDDGVRASAQVDRDDRQRLVHRHHEIPGAIDPLPVTERLEQRLAEHDADILDGVMLIDVEVAGGAKREIEAAMSREQLEHVVEEPDTGPDVVAA